MKWMRMMFFAWYFVMAGNGGSFTPRIYMQFGPYDTEDDCQNYAAGIVTKAGKGILIFPCWKWSGIYESDPTQPRAKR